MYFSVSSLEKANFYKKGRTMDKVKVFAPATVANLCSGYDLLGLAIDSPGDEVVLTAKNQAGLKITKIEGDDGKLPYDPQKNCVTVAIQAYLNYMNSQDGFDVELYKKMPIGSGLGSSSASSVAGVYAANYLLGEPLPKKELIQFAIEGERAACGSAHADNVAPSLLGGMVCVSSYKPLIVNEIKLGLKLFLGVIHPDIEIKTADARAVLPRDIPLREVVKQSGHLASLLLGLSQGDKQMIKFGLQDVLVEPHRAGLIPGFLESKELALQMGALGCGISGSGPSIFVMTTQKEEATEICTKISEIFKSKTIECSTFCSAINWEGVRVIK